MFKMEIVLLARVEQLDRRCYFFCLVFIVPVFHCITNRRIAQENISNRENKAAYLIVCALSTFANEVNIRELNIEEM